MPEYLTLDEAFLKCKREGKFIAIEEIDIEKIKSSVSISKWDIEAANILKNNISKDSNLWSSVYKLYYDGLHELAEVLLRFDKIKSSNHQCMFASLCHDHPELDFDWDFYEKIRTKRNGALSRVAIIRSKCF